MPISPRIGKMNGKPASPSTEAEKRAAPTELAYGRAAVGVVGEIFDVIRSGRVCTVRDLAAEFHLSQSHLQHLFKRQTGLGLGHLLIEHKLQLAAQLLQSSKMRIKQIACAVGYEHTSSFVRAFERRFDEAPQTYRERSSRI
jgi:two-component system, response regulator YesN